jgi:hypothetical protein
MKKIILTAIIVFSHFGHAFEGLEQVYCQLPNRGEIKALFLESGVRKYSPNQTAVDTQGTLALLGANGILEKVIPTTGIGGTFNQFNFPSNFMYTNDAQKSQVLKFETKQLGQVLIAYICNRPNAYPCEDRSGNLVDTARVAININGKTVLNFDGKSLPFCRRNVL